MNRNKDGYVILDNSIVLDKGLKSKGRKPKLWLKYDEHEYLFKSGSTNNEIWAELIASELGKQCGLKMASYDLAVYHGEKGVMSLNFLNPGDSILSGEHLLDYGCKIMNDNDIRNSGKNTIENIIRVLPQIYNPKIENIEFQKDLIKMWAFDGLTLESDRNSTNWAFIQKENTIELSPIYDCSTIGRLNENIKSFLESMRFCGIENIINNVKFQLTLKDSDKNDDFLSSFEKFCLQYDILSDEIMNSFNQINVDEAIKNIENRINIGNTGERIEMPWDIGLWLSKVIQYRLESMNMIYMKSKKEEKELGFKR